MNRISRALLDIGLQLGAVTCIPGALSALSGLGGGGGGRLPKMDYTGRLRPLRTFFGLEVYKRVEISGTEVYGSSRHFYSIFYFFHGLMNSIN